MANSPHPSPRADTKSELYRCVRRDRRDPCDRCVRCDLRVGAPRWAAGPRQTSAWASYRKGGVHAGESCRLEMGCEHRRAFGAFGGLVAGGRPGASRKGMPVGADGGAEQGAGESRPRLSQLREALTLINESAEFETVLTKVLESALSIAGGCFGFIVLANQENAPTEFLFAGLAPEQADAPSDTSADAPSGAPDWLRPLEPLLESDEVERHDRLDGLLSGGGPADRDPPPVSPDMSYLSAPLLSSDTKIGSMALVGQDGGFSEDDEESLVMFAFQVSLFVSNERRCRQEQRVRADLEALVSTAPVCVMVLDGASGEITSIYKEAKRVLGDRGMTLEELQRVVFAGSYQRANGQVISEDSIKVLDAIKWGETVRDEEMIVHFDDGRTVVAMVNATPIRSVDGTVESVVVTAQDMEPLAEIERLRAEFLGMIGHELRTPLAAIKGSATTLRQGDRPLEPAEMEQFFRVIDEQADYMRELLRDLIDMVRIETGSLQVNASPLELRRIVEEARNVYIGSGGRHNLCIDLPEDLPKVVADRVRVVQVITNLLINASRQSHEATPIRIEAALAGDAVAVSVVDNGRGLLPERLSHLFEKFSRPDSSEQGRDLGLGLAICKGIVEAHGGRIWAESDGPGLGSRFIFTISADPGSGIQPHTPTAALSATRGRAGPTRILAVDDDPVALKHARDCLSDAGYEAIVTGDPDEAVRLVEEAEPHLVLLDVMLHDVDGIELMGDIRAVADTPVIFISAYNRDELIARALQEGARDYITKPYSPTELSARIDSALRDRSRQPKGRPKQRFDSGSFAMGDLTINYAERSVVVAGAPVDLTPTEFELLAELSAHQGVPLTHEYLLGFIWGLEDPEDAQRMRTVVTKLRSKLGDDARQPRYIETVPRVGYRMPKAPAG